MSKYLVLAVALLFSTSIQAETTSMPSTVSYQAATAWLNKDYQTAHRLFETLAKSGDLQAQDRLASLYYYGQGVPRNYQQAASLYKQAAQKGVVASQYMMGYLYWHGQGVVQDYNQALRYMSQTATSHPSYLPATQRSNNTLTQAGQQISRLSYINRHQAEERWVLLAQRDLGTFYRDGVGVKKDYVKAYAWYQLVASRGDSQSQQLKENLEPHMSKQDLATAHELANEYTKKYGTQIIGGKGTV